MQKRKSLTGVKSLIRNIEGFVEVALLTLVYYFVWRRGYDEGLFPLYHGYGKYILAGVYGLLMLVMFVCFDGFKFGYLRISEALLSQWIALFIVNFVTYWQHCLIANGVVSPVPMLVVMVLGAIIAFVCTVIYNWVYHRLYVPKNMVLIFGPDQASMLKLKMETRPDKYHITKLIPAEEGLEKICQQIPQYDAVVISDIPSQLRNDILKFCYGRKIRTYLAPKLTDIVVRGATNINLFDTPLLLVKGNGLTPSQCFFKRAMDLILCLPVAVVAAPIMALVAIAIKMEDGGPVFYKQERVTLNGKRFYIVKFRSMIVDAEKDGKSVPATEGDPRITKVGKFIRATRFDELPQLLNIIKGDMSIVGPRPERVEHMEEYGKQLPEFDFRTKVKGGLTGYAQIYGKYNTSPYDKLRLDMMYVENYSLFLDIKLILLTLRIIFSKESTEGFDEIKKNEEKLQQILDELHHETDDAENDKELAGIFK